MQYIGQNWIWIVVIAAFVAFHLFGHGRHGHGGSGGGSHRHGSAEGLGGVGHGGQGHGGHGPGDEARSSSSSRADVVIDPVSGSAVATTGAITSIYQGNAYYFASKENRDRFEAAPQDFARKVQGDPIEANGLA